MTVYLPDGTALELADGATGADAARAIGAGLARAALAVRVERAGRRLVQDLAQPLADGDRIEILTERSHEDNIGPLWLIRHDAAHVLAEAVLELWPGTKVAIGPPIDDGFYYDFEFPPGVSVSVEDLPAIEERMRAHIAADERFERIEMPAAEARALFERAGQPYKVELIDDLVRDQGVETVSLYRNGPFLDLCRGPHGPSTGRIGAFKLTAVAGAYWRGDASRQQLTRIYGTAFFRKRDLDRHLELIELAKARDHRRLGRELGLFMLSELSPGSPFWLPRGTALWNELTRLWREENQRRGYLEVRTPILYDIELWKRSGHWDKFRENMYFTEVEGRAMGLKPMNCPAHIQIYRRERRSYRDLPLRLAEQGLVHRHEPGGTLHGLLRVRHITQDDAHIFCRQEQVRDEVLGCLAFAFDLYELFGFEPRAHLSTRPEQRIGSDELWDQAEAALRSALEGQGLDYKVDPGEGTFYGPKIDLHMTDALGRSWQLGTIQLDYQMPERFDLTYVGEDNAEHRPVMIHRALMGSFERFIGILIEHYGGHFPFWLAPLQVAVLPIADRHVPYAREVAAQLAGASLRVEVDERSESVRRKIRDAELAKVPYMLVVGDEEERQRTVAVRRRGRGDAGSVELAAFVRERADAYARRARD